ncbi:universal stress protein [Dokdonella ginsengisoli]|uniref:Universal stress protein n=1 Tax=Dokdonella ginsengisoli TaxID=363846 RepID=A0ABV9QWR5_9GAMM
MRDILALAADYRSWDGGMAYAADLAARLDGTLTGVFVQPSPLLMMPGYSSPDLLEAVIENARDVERKAHDAQGAFVAWAKTIGARRVAWQVAEGHVPEVLARLGNWHDLLVLERNAQAPWGSPPDLGMLALRTHLPCLVVPRDWRVARLDRIALGWNGSAESLRAIHASIPLLQHASKVALLDGGQRDPDLEIGWIPHFDVEAYLRLHCVEIERIRLDTDDERAGETLLDAAADIGAELLVMGAYGRTRISEWAFGGATRKVLADATIPLFLRH